MLADALPDRFGNRLIDAWLAESWQESGKPSTRSTAYATSAAAELAPLSSSPPLDDRQEPNELEVARLVDLANRVLDERANFAGRMDGDSTMPMLLRTFSALALRQAARVRKLFLPGARQPANSDPVN